MNKFQFLIMATIEITILDCKKNIIQDVTPDGWKEVTISNIIPNDCGCDKIVIKQISDFSSAVYGPMDSLLMKRDTLNAIVLDTLSKTCTLILKYGIMVGTSKICNYPAEMNSWDLKGGKTIDVIISGSEYESCVGTIGPAIYTYSDIILTKLLKKLN